MAVRMVSVYSTTLATAVASLTITGLDGDADGIYYLSTRIVASATGDFSCLVNNDTSTGYGVYYVRGVSTASAAGGGTVQGLYKLASAGAAGDISKASMTFYAKSGYVRTGLIECADSIATTTVTQIASFGVVWNNTGDNVTSFTILGPAATSIGVGTTVNVFKATSM